METKRRLKVLYVCPFAHYSGHPPWAATYEPDALARAGGEVNLLTFCGITGEIKVKVPHLTVMSQARFTRPIQRVTRLFLARWTLSTLPIMFLENFLTLAVAIRLKRKLKYDIIHLRDGEPFLFTPLLLSLPQRIGIFSFEDQAHLESLYQLSQLTIVSRNDRCPKETCLPE